ncbi:carboxypeptidase regulatory-like domain-containing protein, partial [Candidatus Parcubacteria bacterium]|nr:carboxypeptidase regulatory-like domain-containing protein [Candidatus Parcubacteria bacterium]
VSEGQPNGQPGPSESGTPSLSGAGDVRLERNDLELSVAGGTIILSLGEKGTIDILPKTLMRLMVSQDELLDLRTLTVTVDEQTYLLRLENQPGGNALYFADITAPEAPQLYTMGVTAQYTDGGTQAVSSLLNVVPWGAAVQVIDGEEAFVSGVKATLSEMVGGKSVVWDGSPYNQFNPATTGVDGTFGWYVPNGTYRLSAQADTFLSYAGDSFTVRNFIANPRIVLVAVPKPTEEESANIVETAKKAAVVVASKLENVLNTPLTQTVQETLEIVRESETVQKTVDIATPTIAVTAGASVLVMTVAFDLLPFLHYVFTAPILLLWRRKRKGYGVVYHAVSRLPVDLAVVRLFLVEDETKPGPGRLIQSRVTDKQGRFFFLIQPGSYRLTATKAGLRFPTDYLKEVRDDGTYLDVYHGELIRVTEQDAVITPNIPLDPVEAGQTQSSTRAVWQARLRWLQRLVAVSGVLISFAVLLIRPSVLAGAMMIVQVLVYLLARRLARPRKPKNWGIVYDRETKRPLANVVARVFEPKYNKLLHTVVTDTRGRYAFLLGPSEYYAVFEKQGYRPTQVRPIDLRGKAGALDFAVDVEMHVAQAPSVPVGPTQPGEAIGPEDSS